MVLFIGLLKGLFQTENGQRISFFFFAVFIYGVYCFYSDSHCCLFSIFSFRNLNSILCISEPLINFLQNQFYHLATKSRFPTPKCKTVIYTSEFEIVGNDIQEGNYFPLYVSKLTIFFYVVLLLNVCFLYFHYCPKVL